jgi:hypothetical protein
MHAPIPAELDRDLAARLEPALGGGPVPVSALLVVASETAWHDGWSVRALIAIADHLAQSRHCLVLDLALEGGELHPSVDVENLEGVADIFLYGASLKHVVQRPPNHRFDFAPAGLGGEPKRVLTDTRWRRLLNEQQAAGVLLIGYVPVHSEGIEILSDRIPNIIALARPEELSSIDQRLSPDATVVSVVSPVDPIVEVKEAVKVAEPAAAPVMVGEEEEPEPTPKSRERDFEALRVPRNAAREALIADLRARQRAALMTPSPVPPVADEETPLASLAEPRLPAVTAPAQMRPAPSLTEPSFATAEPRPVVKSRKGIYIALSLVVLAALIVGAWLVVQRQVELSAAPPVPDLAAPSAPAAAPLVQGPNVPLPYSVAVEAHQELPLALDRVEALSDEEKDIGFYIAPILVDSVLYYRIMAGPVVDSTSAIVIMERLLEKGHKTGKSEWDLRRTPLAFSLGDYENMSDARSRANEAGDLGIPAYLIEVQSPEGARRFRVYAGAYAGVAEADVMRRLLRSAGLPDSLIPRVGIEK